MAQDSKMIHKIIMFSAMLALFFSFTPYVTLTAFADDDDDKKKKDDDRKKKDDDKHNDRKVYVCHNDNNLQISSSALPAHLAHGDSEGKCNDKNVLKWVVKVLRKIMTGDIEWVHWDSLKDDTIPAGLLDGDDDTLGTLALTCERGDVVKLDGTNTWVCADDLDTLGSLQCSDGEIAVFNGVDEIWECGTGGGGAGDIEAVFAGTGLTGGGAAGEVTLDVDGNQVALLDQDNIFTGDVAVEGSLLVDTFDFDISNPSFICTDSSGCMPGSVLEEESVTASRIDPSAISLDVVTKTESLSTNIEPDDSGEFTVSCDDSSEQITGFAVALPNNEAPITFTEIEVDDSTRDTITLEIWNNGEENTIIGIDITLFCASVSP